MGVEEQLRDSKGCRFGLQMEWTQCRTPEYLSRLALPVGVAMTVWTAVGAAVAAEESSVQMPCKQKGARLSLLAVCGGAFAWCTDSTIPSASAVVGSGCLYLKSDKRSGSF
jgi:hypothetical protein